MAQADPPDPDLAVLGAGEVARDGVGAAWFAGAGCGKAEFVGVAAAEATGVGVPAGSARQAAMKSLYFSLAVFRAGFCALYSALQAAAFLSGA